MTHAPTVRSNPPACSLTGTDTTKGDGPWKLYYQSSFSLWRVLRAAAASLPYLKNVNLGGMGNMIAGAIGGVGGGQLASLTGLLGAAGGAAAGGDAASGLDFGNLIGSAVSGGAGGAILTGIVGSIMGGKKE